MNSINFYFHTGLVMYFNSNINKLIKHNYPNNNNNSSNNIRTIIRLYYQQ